MLYLLLVLVILLLCYLAYVVYKAKNIAPPVVADQSIKQYKTTHDNNNTIHYYHNTFIQENDYGIYELYTEGTPFERGYSMGKVSETLKYQHEKNFIDSIRELVPSETYLNFLKFFIGIFNRKLHTFIKKEYQEELYGLSFTSSTEYNFIAPAYQRVLNYHAAHDIGHALQNIGLVGCSSFVVKDSKSADGDLLLARNLDFSPSENFNDLKVLYFINPNNGHKYVSYSWPGFIGVVSGMNEHGLCVVLHSAKSKMRFSIGTPVSIIAKEILQEAKNISEARKILLAHTSFVSELFFIVSAQDNTAVVFEKHPESLDEFQMESEELICTNHLLSTEAKNNPENILWKNTISSAYREERLKELLGVEDKINPVIAAKILRDIRGHNDEDIGMQNEEAINQFAAHHGIIFKPKSLRFWVSANPYMMGAFVAYDFEKSFRQCKSKRPGYLYVKEQTIARDSFLESEKYQQFLAYKTIKKTIIKHTKDNELLNENELLKFEQLNPKLFYTHEVIGDYYLKHGEKEKAKLYFKQALELSIPSTFEKKRIEKKWSKQ